MGETEQHQMVLHATHASGSEEWHCPRCGRRILMQWPPNYKRIVLEPGDEHAYHSGGKGGLSHSASRVTTREEDVLEERLLYSPWMEWLETVDFESWWA